ncbi:MAG: amidohydrolase family protein [Geodermatophilaceae bacterium]|nr:amidohydrolase family protein [Geodermatophilaceae bacterium]
MLLATAAVPLLAACATTPAAAPVPSRAAPIVDYHQHLVSPAFEPIAKLPQRDGAALVKELDAAGIERAVVLSMGYSFGDERKALNDPDRLTREENDWTSAEVTRNAPHLIGFCSANPLRPVALEELERCLGLQGMTGIKVHLGNAGITLRDPAHLARIQQLFALAQRRRAPVLIHMRTRGGTNYGAEDAQIFLDKFVGYQMAKEIERRCGAACIRRLLQQPSVEFFLQYISLYREHPDIVGRFSPETERHLSSLR